MEQNIPENWILIAKYLKDEISEEEKSALFKWLRENPENQATYDQMKEVWELASRSDGNYEPDVDAGWQEFKAKITEEIVPEKDGIFEVIQFISTTAFMKIAAVFIILVGLGYMAARYIGNERANDIAQQATYIEYTTLAKEERQVILPDSSRILLKENSHLFFSGTFNEKDRVVTLSGEAFFDIRKANGRKFTVYSGKALTQVLGTSFIIRAYSFEKEVTLKVITGKVAFSSVKDSVGMLYLMPGDQAKLNAEEKVSRIVNTDMSERKKLAGIEFNDIRLADVFNQLEENYGVTIKITDPDLSNCHFTGTFVQADIEKIIKAITISLNLSCTYTENGYLIKGRGCK